MLSIFSVRAASLCGSFRASTTSHIQTSRSKRHESCTSSKAIDVSIVSNLCDSDMLSVRPPPKLPRRTATRLGAVPVYAVARSWRSEPCFRTCAATSLPVAFGDGARSPPCAPQETLRWQRPLCAGNQFVGVNE
eukprot:scaffold6114_cov60-Phaeocystis_antarctica.AAC.3